MRCFECGCKCVTKYNEKDGIIASIQKECLACGWKSYPIKIPDKLNRVN